MLAILQNMRTQIEKKKTKKQNNGLNENRLGHDHQINSLIIITEHEGKCR